MDGHEVRIVTGTQIIVGTKPETTENAGVPIEDPLRVASSSRRISSKRATTSPNPLSAMDPCQEGPVLSRIDLRLSIVGV
jgi:hypothetical protein